ncbi:MAG: hypothetical protein IJ489_10170 [Clostridia bacterium]|nr:hypothetical protein [Clostridia bacterium]
MNIRLFKAKMILSGDDGVSIAKVIGVSPQRHSMKLNGTQGAEYRQSEIKKLIAYWHLTPQEVFDIFFAENDSITQGDTKCKTTDS